MASMDLSDYVDALRTSLTQAAAAAGDQARETARLLADTMEPAIRLTVTNAMSDMAAEVTAALEGGLVDIRLRGRDRLLRGGGDGWLRGRVELPHDPDAEDHRRSEQHERQSQQKIGFVPPQKAAGRLFASSFHARQLLSEVRGSQVFVRQKSGKAVRSCSKRMIDFISR